MKQFPPETHEHRRKAIESELEKEKKTSRRLWKWLIFLILVSFIAVLAAVVVFYAFRQAKFKERVANQQQESIQQERDRASQERDNVRLDALNKHARILFLSKESDLKSLIAAIKAGKELKQTKSETYSTVKNQIILNLREIVYDTFERNRLRGHASSVFSVAFSPDGNLLASGSAAEPGNPSTIKLWNVNYGFEIKTLTGHRHTVSSVKFNPDGKILASGSIDGTIKLWNLANGNEINSWECGRSVYSVDFSPDGKIIASGCDNVIKLWNVTGREIRRLQGHQNHVSEIRFSPDGKILASGGYDNTVKLWNVKDGREVFTLQGHSHAIESLDFSPDGQILATGSQDATIKLWNIETGEEIRTLHANYRIEDINFSPDGQMLAASLSNISSEGLALYNDNKTVKLWHVSDWKEITTLPGHAHTVRCINFSPDGTLLASGDYDGDIKLWDVEDKNKIHTFPMGSNSVLSFDISSNGEILATGNFDDRIIKLWETGGNHLHSGFIADTAEDGRIVLLQDFNYGGIKLWNIVNGQKIVTLQGHRDQHVFSVQFSPDGKTLASSGDYNEIKLWNTENGSEIRTLKGFAQRVTCIAFSPDGKILASGGDPPGHQFHINPEIDAIIDDKGTVVDNQINLWDVGTGRPIKTLQGHYHFINSLVFSPKGGILVSSSADNTVKWWDIANGKEIKNVPEKASSLTFSPDGTILATANGRIIKFWNVADGKEIRMFQGHLSGVGCIVFNPDSTMLASGSSDNTIKIWSVVNGSELATLRGHSEAIYKILFSPDGKKLMSRSWDKTIKIWNLDLDDLLARGCKKIFGYLKTNPNVTDEERVLCDDIIPTELGNYYYSRGQFDEALSVYQKLLTEASEYQDVWYGMGRTLYEKSRFVEAVAAFQKQVQITPDHADAWYRLGKTLAIQRRYDDAIIAFQKQLYINPEHKDALHDLKLVLNEQRKLDEVTDNYQKQAELLQAQQQWNEAININRIILALKPDHKMAWNNLGIVLAQQGMLSEAISAYQKQIEIKPDHHWAWNNLGDALKKQRNFEEAIAAYQQQLALNPNHKIAWNNLGLVLWQQDSYEKAIRRAKAAHNTEEPLKQQLLQQDKLEEAMAAFQKQVEVNPDCDEAWDNIRRMLREQNRTEEILAVYQKHVEANPSHQNAWRLLGMELKRQGKMNEAIKAYQKQVEINPGDDTTWTVLGSELWNNNRKDEAASAYAHAIQLRPKDIKLLHNDAKLALIQGDRERCQKRIAEALPLITTEDSDLSVNLLFFQWLAEPEQDIQRIITAIEKLPSKTAFRGNFSTLLPVIERQKPPTQRVARTFIEFFENKIDLPTLKERIGEVDQ